MNRMVLLVLLGAIAVGAGCGGGRGPEVAVLGATPDALDPNDDASNDLTIRVHYDDGDGRLGGGVARIIDCRADGLVTELPLPEIASPAGVKAGAHIAGELDLLVADVGAVAPASKPPAACADLGVGPPEHGAQAFCVVLVDSTGVAGEGACTRRITVSAP